MKLATNRYIVKIKNLTTGKTSLDGYYGYTNRKQAQTRADAFNSIPNTEAWVVDTKKEGNR